MQSVVEIATEPTHPPVAGGLVMVDFDGTIVPWGPLMGRKSPGPGVVEAMWELKVHGYRIGIFTSRKSRTWARDEVKRRYGRTDGPSIASFLIEQEEYVRSLLTDANVPFDFITAEKMPAEAYFDDKAWGIREEYPLPAAILDFLEQPC